LVQVSSAQLSQSDRTRRIAELRGDTALPPDGSIVLPVNARADLERVLVVLDDLLAYAGKGRFELLLMVNNYPPEQPPAAIATYTAMGLKVVAQPAIRKAGEGVAITARALGTRAITSPVAIHIDADIRVPHPTPLLDWYVEQIAGGAKAAYTHVGYYDLAPHPAVRFRLLMHVASRWVKRVLLRKPTLRGSAYAIDRDTFLAFYDEGTMADERSIGPTIQARMGRVAYSGARRHRVLTSGRYWQSSWGSALRYVPITLRNNLRQLRVRRPPTGP
jgi:hypothetical protein